MSTFTPKFRPNRRQMLQGTGAALVGLTFLPNGAMAAEEKKLNFYNWDTYIGENTLADFNKASGIEVKMDLYADNAELFAKLKEGNPGYDLIVPTNDYVERMIAAGMLAPLNHSKIPNLSNIDKPFQDASFDPGRKYSVAYMWGTQGIGYRKSKVTADEANSWKVLFDDDKHAGRIALLGDGESVIGAALKYLGYSFNSVDPAEMKKAEELLIAGKKNVKVYADDNGQDLLAAGEVDLTMEWNGDIIQVMGEDDDLSYVVPKEGGLLWQDCLCVPTGAPHPENAHAFINYMLEAEAGKHIAETIEYATPNVEAKKLMDGDYRENPGIFPPPEVVEVSEASLYSEERIKARSESWTRIQAA